MSEKPLFSVIVPHYNDLPGLAVCLDGLYRQDLPTAQFEIIVIDDASPCQVEAWIRNTYPEVRFFRQPTNMGPGAARNRGCALTRGAYMAFIDSDALPGSSWLSTYAGELAKGAQIACGPVWHDETMLARLTALTAFGEYMDSKNSWRRHCPGVNFVIAASVMEHFSYDETLGFAGEDVILSTQLTSAGHKIRYLASAWVRHLPRLSLRSYFRRAFLYGIGFRASRSRCPILSGSRLHRYLRAGSAFPLFFIRTGLDMVRLWKLRARLGLTVWNSAIFAAGIIGTRMVYALGVAWGYCTGATR